MSESIIRELFNYFINETSMFTFSIIFLSSFVLMNIFSSNQNGENSKESSDNNNINLESEIFEKLTDKEIASHYINFLESLTKKNIEEEKKSTINHVLFRDKDPRVLVVYASQSNTSKNFAETIKKDSLINNLKVSIKNISEITNDDFKSNLIMLFFISTYGEGEPTDDALFFFKNLEKIEKNDNLYYSIFGLGSTKYEKFNQSSINLDNHFKKMKLNELIPLTLGDDSINIRKDFNNYKEYLYQQLDKFFTQKIPNNDRLLQFIIKNKLNDKLEDESNEFEVIVDSQFTKSKLNEGIKPNMEDYDYSLKNFLSGKICDVKDIQELRKSNINGSTLKINYHLNELTFETGDNIGIYPTNLEQDVDFVLKRLKLDPESIIRVFKKKIKLSKKISIPDNFTIRELLCNYLDLGYKIE